MSAVVVEIGADASAFQKAVDGLPSRMNAAAGQMTGAMQRAASGSTRSIGQMAMQMQDVVVQLQMGTRWTTVLAQQGSQMLSAFGAGGAIAGGVIALGGAFLTMGENANKAFEEAKAAAAEFNKEVANVAAFGTATDIGNTFANAARRAQSELDRASASDLNGSSLFDPQPLISAIQHLVGVGPDQAEVLKQALQASTEAVQAMATLEQAMLATTEREARIAELRAEGRAEEAKEMERQLKLAQEIARVQSFGMSPQVTSRVISNLQRQYAPEQRGGSMFADVIGGVSRALPDVIEPVSQVIQRQLQERARAISAEASALRSAAFGGLRGDADTSFGRGRSMNTLNNGGARMVAEMLKQSSILQQQAKSMDRGNAHLAEIEKAVKKFTPAYQ